MFAKKRKKTSEFSTYRKGGGLWQWVMAGVVMVVFAVIVGYAYIQKEALETEMLNPPLIVAQDTPIKTRAENPGGIDIPNQNKKVFDLLEKVNKKEFNKPIKTEIKKTSILRDIASPKKAKITIPKSELAPKKVVYSPKKTDGDWGVQLASFTNKKDARSSLAKFYTNHYELLKDLKSDLQRANVHGKKYYRARFVGIQTKNDARKICEILKRKKQGCLPIKK